MKKKVLVPVFLLEILEKDCSFFKISKDNLCNQILLKFSLRFCLKYQEDMIFEENDYLQFNIHKDNQRLFIEINQEELRKELGKELSDSELLREVFLAYATLPPFLRETHLFKEKVNFLHSSYKDQKVIKIDSLSEIIEGKVEKIFRCPNTDYLKIMIHKKEFYLSQIRVIS